MNSLSSYCGLVDARISASEKDLPVQTKIQSAVFLCTDIADQLKKRFPSILPTLQYNYGMTEMAVISISTSPKVLGSLLTGCEVKVLGKNTAD
jgi:hypothetical protein